MQKKCLRRQAAENLPQLHWLYKSFMRTKRRGFEDDACQQTMGNEGVQ
jgi:hypothetical protein